MPLSQNLIAKLVNATSQNAKTKKEKIVYGTIKVNNGVSYVQLDGSTILTPISKITTDINVDQRVIAMIKNHEIIITGNVDAPSGYVEEIDENSMKKLTPIKQYIDDGLSNKIESVPITSITALWDEYFTA